MSVSNSDIQMQPMTFQRLTLGVVMKTLTFIVPSSFEGQTAPFTPIGSPSSSATACGMQHLMLPRSQVNLRGHAQLALRLERRPPCHTCAGLVEVEVSTIL